MLFQIENTYVFVGSIQPKNVQSNDDSQECDSEGNDTNAEINQPKAEVKNIKQKAAKCYYSKNVVPGHAGIFNFYIVYNDNCKISIS